MIPCINLEEMGYGNLAYFDNAEKCKILYHYCIGSL